ncbi:MAG: TAT-variant-translocated molybdopterin oxidoreductase [Chitinophagales bacterium]
MKQPKYWKGYEELQNDTKFLKQKRSEFSEDLPLLTEIKNVVSEQQGSRRDFLKIMGFSTVAATIAASCEIPVKKVIPYLDKPEQIIPGIATYYASSYVNGKDYCSILVKTREGRPIKIEGNKLSGISQGGTSARAQASVVSLYDGARLRYAKKGAEKISWEDADREIMSALRNANGQIVLLSDSIISPSTRKAIEDFKAAYSNVNHVVYEPISNSGISTANQRSFGKKVIPSYDFGKAEVIVSFGADFLNTWISPTEFTKQYIQNRKVSKDHPKMSKHWQFESYMSVTGSNADKRVTIKPSEEGKAVVALYNALKGGSVDAGDASDSIKKAALELKGAQGKSLVVSGSNDANVQQVVNAINEMLGNYGSTIDLDAPYNVGGDDKAVQQLVADMNAGKVGAVILYNVNPAYSYPKAAEFTAGLQKVGLTVSFNEREDETSEFITYKCPDSHYLESWNDAEPKGGYFSLGQPTISPLFDTRQAQQSLLRWSGSQASYYDYIKAHWSSNLFAKSKFKNFQAFWDAALHDGIFEVNNPEKTKGNLIGGMYNTTAATSSTSTSEEETETAVVAAIPPIPAHVHEAETDHNNHDEVAAEETTTLEASGSDVSDAIRAIGATQGGDIELVLYENTNMGDGRYANNPYLQENPDNITKVTWDNVLAVSKSYAEDQGWIEKDIIKVTKDGYSVELPLIFQPGQKKGTVSIALGYGRTKSGSKFGESGVNVFPMMETGGETFGYNVLSGVTLEKVGSGYPLAQTQIHHTIDDTGALGNEREGIVVEMSLDEYKTKVEGGHSGTAKDAHGSDDGHGHDGHGEEGGHDEHFFTLYGEDPVYGSHTDQYKRGHHWGMAIDLNSCIGCGACVVACNVENNVPVVGRTEVFRAHEMHWMRIDRYYSGDDENPEVTYMPMMCQHCDNAPCENVCPVAATNHSSEGLNQMAYNRCIGTRYCANNCPFKVRRFNWFDYQSADSFYKDSIFDNDDWSMTDDLTRMVLNPDVTVRSRGVMEKCSFCVQNIQAGKLEAKKAGRKLKDGEVQTACQTSCPAEAIVFGDMNDKDSALSKMFADDRSYDLLHDIHVLSSVKYMTKVRNKPAEAHANAEEHHEDGHS